MRSGQSRFSSGSHVLSSLQSKTTAEFYIRAACCSFPCQENSWTQAQHGDAESSSCLDAGVLTP